MSSPETRTRGLPDGGGNPSAPLCPLTPRAVASLLSGPEERTFSFFDNTGILSRDRLAGWEGQGAPGTASPLLARSWFGLLGAYLPAAGGCGGSRPGKRLPWQPGPKPRPSPAKGVPSTSCPLAESADPGSLGRPPGPPSRSSEPGRQGALHGRR